MMTTLHALIPDVDVLLALAPEELAPILIRLAKQARVNNNNMLTLSLGAIMKSFVPVGVLFATITIPAFAGQESTGSIGLGDYATWAGAIVSVIAAIWAGSAARRAERLSEHANEIAYNAWIDQYFDGVRIWADEVSNTIQMGLHVGKLAPSKDRDERLLSIRATLASLTDRGRWHFPNEWQEKYGTHKAPAYRGFRQPVVTSVVRAYQVLQKIDSLPDGALNELMVKHQREFVSAIQEVLDPRSRANEAQRIIKRFADVERMRKPAKPPLKQ
ncbi:MULTISPECIES: hypothetical protein [Paraburkholderia]|uniref:hypothetical protein n=1 Tax=Paraburkholderia TaxID=1822464 RepID=UPI0012EC5160|nr:hypothetical protein [Paraburkholderia ferrariae]